MQFSKICKAAFVAWLICIYCCNSVIAEPKEYSRDTKCHDASEDCVCIMEILIRDLRNYLLWKKGEKLEEDIKDWKCTLFIRLPDKLQVDGSKEGLILEPPANLHLSLSSDENSVRGYFVERRKKRSMKKPNHIFFGAPTNEALEEAIAKVDPNAFHHYVTFRSTAKMKCAGPGSDLVELEGRIEKITWMHFNGNPLHPKTVANEETGILEIPETGLSDVDIYNCSISYRDEVSESPNGISIRTFSHQLSVVTEPLFMLQLFVKHRTQYCNPQETKLMQETVPTWIEKYISKSITVHEALVTCGSLQEGPNAESGNGEQAYTIEMKVSSLGLKLGMHEISYESIKSCSISCLEHILTKVTEIVRDSLTKIFRLPILVKDSARERVTHPFVEKSLKLELMLGCVTGFALNHKLCFPCNPGFYSQNAVDESCTPCPIDTYQPQPAASKCIPCPEDQTSETLGSISRLDCYSESAVDAIASAVHLENIMKDSSPVLIGGIISGSFILLIITIFSFVCCCCPNSGFGRCLRKVFCCTADDSEVQGNSRERKSRRNPNTKRRQN